MKLAPPKMSRCVLPPQSRTLVVVYLAVVILALGALPSQAQSPTITSISPISTQQFQTITIVGSGFGTQKHYTGDSAYISLLDETGSWQAGFVGIFEGVQVDDTVTLIVNSWQDSKIVLGGFSGQWGQFNFILNKGDTEQVSIWNAQSGAGPATMNVTVGGELTKTSLTSSPNPSTAGQPVTFTASVISKAGAPPDGETVSFMQGKALIGTGTLSGGTAMLVTSRLKVGDHTITAIYAGDANFDNSNSRPVKQVVNAAD